MDKTLCQTLLPPDALRIIAELERRGIRYWVDSGTLLGLVRDGRLLPGDNDVDIGILSDDLSQVGGFLDWLKSNYPRHATRTARGATFKAKVPVSHDLAVDLNFFQRTDGQLICPAIRGVWLDAERRNGSSSVRLAYLYVTRAIMRRMRSVEITRWPARHAIYSELWEIPEVLIGEPRKHQLLGAYVPQRLEDYLRYRYHDWQTPSNDWFFPRDDGAYRATDYTSV